MTRLRLFGSILYYLTFVYVVQAILQWIDPTVYDSVGGRWAAVGVGALTLAAFAFFSEVYDVRQGLRDDLLDVLLGDRRDY